MSSPNKNSEPGGAYFTKGFRFGGNLCFMRSLPSWLISIVSMPSNVIKSIRSVKIILKSPSISKSFFTRCHDSIRGLDNMQVDLLEHDISWSRDRCVVWPPNFSVAQLSCSLCTVFQIMDTCLQLNLIRLLTNHLQKIDRRQWPGFCWPRVDLPPA